MQSAQKINIFYKKNIATLILSPKTQKYLGGKYTKVENSICKSIKVMLHHNKNEYTC